MAYDGRPSTARRSAARRWNERLIEAGESMRVGQAERTRSLKPCWRLQSYSLLTALIATATATAFCRHATAVTPDSPEVVALVEKGLAYLEKETDVRLGGRCLIALAFHKHGDSVNHPRILEAIEACRNSLADGQSDLFLYSKGLAVIFLAELDDPSHHSLIKSYADGFAQYQKGHGGFGYINYETGDTSQTQYAALAFWEMLNHGMTPNPDSVQRCLKWLMRTQDPSGAWGYQGVDPGSFKLVKQPDNVGPSMGAAGLGGTLILGNSVGLLKPPAKSDDPVAKLQNLPPALRRTDLDRKAAAMTVPPGDVDRSQLETCVALGNKWFEKNFVIEAEGGYQSYYLYSLERFRSFEEFLSGQSEDEPDWYNKGFEYLSRTQAEDGSWGDSSGSPCATAFSVLFLMRSTQKSIEASLGEGTLIGGRGLPRDLSKLKLRGGKLVVQQKTTELDSLLDMLSESNNDELDELLNQPAALSVADAGADQARRLQQIVRSGSAEARLLAVRALAKLRNLDHAPTLIFALTDPDMRVVREARDGLRFVSRNFEGFGPPDNFEASQRDQAVVRWKEWYVTVRPDAPPLP